VSSLSSRSLPRSRSGYQVDSDRHSYRSCSSDRNDPFYSSYFQDCVDREGGECPLRLLDCYRALVAPTKTTLTDVTTFPVLRTGTILSTLPILKIVSTRKGVSIPRIHWPTTTLASSLAEQRFYWPSTPVYGSYPNTLLDSKTPTYDPRLSLSQLKSYTDLKSRSSRCY
jgi:hypothetical protein